MPIILKLLCAVSGFFFSFFFFSRRVTFICGEAGVCALGAVVAQHNGDEQLCNRYITQFKEVLHHATMIQYIVSQDQPHFSPLLFFPLIIDTFVFLYIFHMGSD